MILHPGRSSAVALAAAALASSLGFAEESVAALAVRVDADFRAGRFAQARAGYERLEQLAPGDAAVHHRLAETYEKLGLEDKAADEYEREADALQGSASAPAAPPSKSPSPAHARPPAAAPPPAPATPPATSRRFHVGDAVEYGDDGQWRRAVIIAVRDDAYSVYRVHPFGYIDTMDGWVREADVRPAGSGPTAIVPGGEARDPVWQKYFGKHGGAPAAPVTPTLKGYHCVAFIVDHLQDEGDFTLESRGRYRDRNGQPGTWTQDGATLTFHGGALDRQRAEFEAEGGQSRLHILGPSGRRVIDCS